MIGTISVDTESLICIETVNYFLTKAASRKYMLQKFLGFLKSIGLKHYYLYTTG